MPATARSVEIEMGSMVPQLVVSLGIGPRHVIVPSIAAVRPTCCW
jgi:hypothetical protein